MDPRIRALKELYPFDVFYGEMKHGDEMMLGDIIALNTLLDINNPKSILEIGCWTGNCTCLFGLWVKAYGGKVYSIDPFTGSPGSEQEKLASPVKEQFLYNLKKFGLEDTVTLLEGTSDDYADLDQKFDMVFIDGDHRYSQVKKDIDNYLPKVNDGGILAGHDLNSGFYKEEHVENDWVDGIHHGVTKAVMEHAGINRLDSGSYNSIWFKEVQPCLVA